MRDRESEAHRAAEADRRGARGRDLEVAERGVEPELRAAVEAAASDRLAIAGRRARGVDGLVGLVGLEPVGRPLPDVADEVVGAVLGLALGEAADGGRAREAVV